MKILQYLFFIACTFVSANITAMLSPQMSKKAIPASGWTNPTVQNFANAISNGDAQSVRAMLARNRWLAFTNMAGMSALNFADKYGTKEIRDLIDEYSH